MKPKLYIIGSAGIPARYGGFETFAENLALHLSNSLDVFIACSSFKYNAEERTTHYNNVTRYFIDNKPNGISSLIYDLRSLIYAVKHSNSEDHIVILGVGPGIFLPFLKLFYTRKFYIHIDGLEWKRAKWNILASAFLKATKFLSLHYANKIVIDHQTIYDSLPSRLKSKARLITYGGDHLPDSMPNPPVEYKYCLLIARAEPENNLEMIIESFADTPEKNLIAITNAKETRHGQYLLNRYGHNKNVHFVDAIYNNIELLQAYRTHCSAYIHGHSAGGTNPSLIEAMYCGLSVIAMDNEFNRITTNNSALYFHNRESLTNQITQVYQNQNISTGKELEQFAKKNYLWKNVAKEFLAILK